MQVGAPVALQLRLALSNPDDARIGELNAQDKMKDLSSWFKDPKATQIQDVCFELLKVDFLNFT